MKIKNIIIWIAILLFPLSHLLQLIKIIIKKSAHQVSLATFFGFFIGNIGAFIFTKKYNDIRSWIGYIFTSILELILVCVILYYTKNSNKIIYVIIVSLIIFATTYYLVKYDKTITFNISSFAGYLPAIIFPVATLFELINMYKSNNVGGVSCVSWIMILIGNIGLYLMTDKLKSLKSISAFVITSIIDLLIILKIIMDVGLKKCLL